MLQSVKVSSERLISGRYFHCYKFDGSMFGWPSLNDLKKGRLSFLKKTAFVAAWREGLHGFQVFPNVEHILAPRRHFSIRIVRMQKFMSFVTVGLP